MGVYSYFTGYSKLVQHYNTPIGMDLTHQFYWAIVGIWRYNFARRAYAGVSVWTLPINLGGNHTNLQYNDKYIRSQEYIGGYSMACVLNDRSFQIIK